MEKSDLVTCLGCGWVHFQVTRDYITKWQDQWNGYWPTLDEEGREAFGLPDGPPTPDSYYICFRCGGSYKNMRDIKDGDIGDGHTIQPILNRSE